VLLEESDIFIDDDNPRRISQRCTAAEVLAHYRATSAMPALVRNLKMETLFKSTELKWFYMEHYPCAQAIVDMGPSALDPFLFELRGPNNNEPLIQLTPHAWERKFTGFDAELAARITFALCGNDFELARKKIAEVEKLAPSRTFFVQMRYHLDHTVNKPPWQFRRRPPTA
jgi:hypothetical protein